MSRHKPAKMPDVLRHYHDIKSDMEEHKEYYPEPEKYIRVYEKKIKSFKHKK